MTALAAGLLAGVVLLAVATAVTVRRPAAPLPDLPGYLDAWAPLHGGYDPWAGGRSVRSWLALVYRLGRPLAAVGVAPAAVSAAGALAAYAGVVAADAGGRWALAAAAAVVVSALCDGLDGCVAVLSRRASTTGYVLDSLVDRVADGLFLVASWRLGAPAGLAVGAGAALVLLEYTRARAGAAGMRGIGVVTVGERPTRVLLTGLALLAAGGYDARAGEAVTAGAAAVTAVSVLGLAQLWPVVARRLR